uniref:Uncharacterized protein n=1 Tax=Knipowitschia caucasica TaxID=637954 RepID=A0AAV2IRR2_KNICA
MLYLHTRPKKETCELKHVNGSESTYGSVQFYYKEGRICDLTPGPVQCLFC